MTQKQRILKALESAGPRGVCLAELDQHDAYTGRNRISELRKDGKPIESERCRAHAHKAPVFRYRLVQPGQMELLP